MRRGFGLLGLLVTIVIVAAVGVIAYQAGWSDGFAQHVPANATAPAAGYYPYYYGPHFFGFGWIFGLLFFLFFLWVIFRVIGFGLWGMRGYRGGPGGWHQFRDERMREWHDRAHSGESGSGSQAPPPPPPPTTA
ncbi:MAG TPA: hypothetical protein VFL29_11575 [Candidatus Dormibacteraeota bacterium]|nr:hypothetical protein [Candidatus Dormibacteraeota bacterium]